MSSPNNECHYSPQCCSQVRPEGKKNFWSWRKIAVLCAPLVWFALCQSANLPIVDLLSSRWTLILTGFAAALIGNISAIGGGIVFIPVMIFCYKLTPIVALKIAIASQSIGMTTGAIGWMSGNQLCKKSLRSAVPGLLIGSTLTSLVFHPSSILVKGLFGPISIILGLLVLASVKGNKASNNGNIDCHWCNKVFFVSIIGGAISGCVAVGEGELVAAYFMLAAGLSSRASIATGVVLLSITSIYLTVLHQFFLGGIPWDYAAFTGLGCVYGASLAPIIARRVNQQKLKIGFACIAIIDGCLFLYQFISSSVP